MVPRKTRGQAPVPRDRPDEIANVDRREPLIEPADLFASGHWLPQRDFRQSGSGLPDEGAGRSGQLLINFGAAGRRGIDEDRHRAKLVQRGDAIVETIDQQVDHGLVVRVQLGRGGSKKY